MKRSAIYQWIDDRLGISQVLEFASHKTVPVHRYSVFYYLGGMTLFFFIVQVCTGILLMLYYRPSAEEAFESVEFIMTVVPFGWLLRSIHSWSANLMVFFAFLHLVSVFFLKSYRAPRELTWASGVLIFFLVMAFGFSGYLLPWNQLAFFATKVGTDIAGVVPGIGGWMLRFLRGGDRVTGGTLSRFYGWHVAILPAITSALVAFHLLLVQIKGMSVPPAVEKEPKARSMKFFPHFALRDLSGWLLALGVLAALAALFPWELGEKADAFAPAYENIRPEWYFVFMFQTLKLVPGGEILGLEYEAIPILFFGLGGLALLLVPFLDRGVAKRGRSPIFNAIGVIALIYAVAMTCWGYASLLPFYIFVISALLLALLAFLTRPQSEPQPGLRAEKEKSDGGTARIVSVAGGALLLLLIAGNAHAAPAKTSCTTCHTSSMFDAQAQAKLHNFPADVHAQVGLSCHDCHGGDPDPKLAEDYPGAMDPKFKANPYVGKPDRTHIPEFCGKCHANAAYMKGFNPAARVDIVSEYGTSRHGQQLAKGDANVATCIDCHGVHGILRKNDPKAPVYRTKVAETCSACHSDPKRMASYKDDHGRPLPVDQYARWKRSVHATAMLEKGDLSAPTCNDCHGNHGATPPGVKNVAFICGNCHGREAELFRTTAKHDGFVRHNTDFLATGASCGDCHPGISPAVTTIHQFSDCVVCHENHGVTRPTVALLGGLPEAPCVFCHEGSGPLSTPQSEPESSRKHYQEVKAALLATAKSRGLEGDARFDWLVDQAQTLQTHLVSRGGSKVELRPEFARLFSKFRIGKTHYTYTDPVTGRTASAPVRQCQSCHLEKDSKGATTSKQLLNAMQQLTSATARAERVLLTAQRGGVEVRGARAELDDAVDSQIELEVLVHSFSSAGPFAEKSTEGGKHATAALTSARKSLTELSYRRNGLTAALGIILLVLGGLVIKIRQLGG